MKTWPEEYIQLGIAASKVCPGDRRMRDFAMRYRGELIDLIARNESSSFVDVKICLCHGRIGKRGQGIEWPSIYQIAKDIHNVETT